MKKTVYATLGVLFAGFLLLWTLGSCPGLMEDPPSPPVPDTEPDRTIRLYGTVSEENGQLYLNIPLPQTETAAGRALFTGNGTTEVANRGDQAAVLDKAMVPKVVNYYELILRRHGVDPNSPDVYRQDAASKQKGYLRIAVEPGDVYDVLLLAGYKDAQTKVLLESAYNDNGGQGFTMVQGPNRVELQLSQTVVALSFPADTDQLAQYIIAKLYRKDGLSFDYSGTSDWDLNTFRANPFNGDFVYNLVKLHDTLNAAGTNLTTDWDTAATLKTAIRDYANGAFRAYTELINSGVLEALYDGLQYAPIHPYDALQYDPINPDNTTGAALVRGFRFWFKCMGQVLVEMRQNVDTLLNTATDGTQRTGLANQIKYRIWGTDNATTGNPMSIIMENFNLLRVMGWGDNMQPHFLDDRGNRIYNIREGLTYLNGYPYPDNVYKPKIRTYFGIHHDGENTPLRIQVGAQLSSQVMTRNLVVKVNILDSATEGLGLKPLYDSWRVSDTSPFGRYPSNGFPVAASIAQFIPSRAGAIGVLPLTATNESHSYTVSTGAVNFEYTFPMPSGDYDGKFVFNLQYYPFGNPFPGSAADREGKLQKTREIFGLPWHIRSGLNPDQEAVYVPSSGSVYSIGGAIRVIVGEGSRHDDAYLTINLVH